MMEWQPIETAPKDGTPVLIYEPPYKDLLPFDIYVCKWCQHKEAWVEFAGEEYSQYDATHWMPLPDAPKD
jgi:hypothetical protein